MPLSPADIVCIQFPDLWHHSVALAPIIRKFPDAVTKVCLEVFSLFAPTDMTVRACVLMILCWLPLSATAQTGKAPLWGGLQPGPYRVGFRYIYRFDKTRTWRE